MPNLPEPPWGYRTFKSLVSARDLPPLESDARMYNLARGYWVYDELLGDLLAAGWRRFAPGFKAGVYGHPDHELCIKLLGMGVGDDPLYFAERGYYLEHERKMMQAFRAVRCDFVPDVLDPSDSVRFLVDEAGVRAAQAELRVARNDLLIVQYIPGIPLATQTGHGLNYDVNVAAFDEFILKEMIGALKRLRVALQKANALDLVHNDPMPPNIIFTARDRGTIEAMLVDFEIAQNLRETSPDFVTSTVEELKRERRVPPETNLDMHELAQSIDLMEQLHEAARGGESLWTLASLHVPYFGSIQLGRAMQYLWSRFVR